MPDLDFDINTLVDTCTTDTYTVKPFQCCPCGSQRKDIIGVTKTDVVYQCLSCGSSWLRSERCQQCAAPATRVINGFGACELCAYQP
jgi:hypothetical protein